MTDKKKYILAGVIAGVAVIGSYVYLQVQKAVNYVMTYKYFKVDKINNIKTEIKTILSNTKTITNICNSLGFDYNTYLEYDN